MIFFSRNPGFEGRFSKLKSIRIRLEDEDEDESCAGAESWVRGFLIKHLSIILAKE